MGLGNRISRKAAAGAGPLFSLLPFAGIARPVFIVGCGRSGTTVFGTILSRHRKITYLNEPRRLWALAYPQTDIWKKDPYGAGGKLCMTAADADSHSSRRISRLFRFETIKSGKPVLVEKLPANSFRLQFISEIFPDARFIHIYRNGLEVARSIEMICREREWYGRNMHKWHELVRLARARSETAGLPDLCSDNFYRGLLEWRLSTEAITGFLGGLPQKAYLEISYCQLLDDPGGTIGSTLEYLGLDTDPQVVRFANEILVRRSTPRDGLTPSARHKAVGGELLAASLDCRTGLSQLPATRRLAAAATGQPAS
jgi:hypothetical protein